MVLTAVLEALVAMTMPVLHYLEHVDWTDILEYIQWNHPQLYIK